MQSPKKQPELWLDVVSQDRHIFTMSSRRSEREGLGRYRTFSLQITGKLAMKGTGAKFTQRRWEEAPSTSIEGTLRFTRV